VVVAPSLCQIHLSDVDADVDPVGTFEDPATDDERINTLLDTESKVVIPPFPVAGNAEDQSFAQQLERLRAARKACLDDDLHRGNDHDDDEAAPAPAAADGACLGDRPKPSNFFCMTDDQFTRLLDGREKDASMGSAATAAASCITPWQKALKKAQLLTEAFVFFNPAAICGKRQEQLTQNSMGVASNRLMLGPSGMMETIEPAMPSFTHFDVRDGCTRWLRMIRDSSMPKIAELINDRQRFFDEAWNLHGYPPDRLSHFILNFMRIHEKDKEWASLLHSDAMTIALYLTSPMRTSTSHSDTATYDNSSYSGPSQSKRGRPNSSNGGAGGGGRDGGGRGAAVGGRGNGGRGRGNGGGNVPPNYCYSRKSKDAGECRYGEDCNRCHDCASCGGQHCGQNCVRWVEATAVANDEARRAANGRGGRGKGKGGRKGG
jgi:hypothetical protein